MLFRSKGRLADREVERQDVREEDRQTGRVPTQRQVKRQAGRQRGRHAERQAGMNGVADMLSKYSARANMDNTFYTFFFFCNKAESVSMFMLKGVSKTEKERLACANQGIHTALQYDSHGMEENNAVLLWKHLHIVWGCL